MGDPGGIGPEIVYKALQKRGHSNDDIVIYGSSTLFNHPFLSSFKPEGVGYRHCFDLPSNFVVGQADGVNGDASYAYLKSSVDDCLSGELDALVTAPICKESLSMAGVPFTGHTTMLQQLCQKDHVSMAFYSSAMSVILVTIHHPLSAVPSLLSESILHSTFRDALSFMNMVGKESPRIGVAGLNPHAGEQGLFGSEEFEIIRPAMDSFSSSEFFYGPYPPDVIFRDAVNGSYDLVVAMYHDQGLIPLKLLAFDEAVNVTVGLPFVRTSPDHGTAFDIAYQGKASETSFESALEFACKRAVHAS